MFPWDGTGQPPCSLLTRVLCMAPQDGDGEISWREFLTAVGNSLSQSFPVQDLHTLAFDIIDTNGSGTLTDNELQVIAKTISNSAESKVWHSWHARAFLLK